MAVAQPVLNKAAPRPKMPPRLAIYQLNRRPGQFARGDALTAHRPVLDFAEIGINGAGFGDISQAHIDRR